MKKIVILFVLLFSYSLNARPSIRWIPLVQQTVAYFSSDRITMGGLGFGVGSQFIIGKHFIAQADAGLLRANGNAVNTRLAFGYQLDGRWQPAILATFNLFWGQRTEILSESGQRPTSPVWVAGFRLAPVRFSGARAQVSALELGYGMGPDRGVNLELTILSVGIGW